MNLVGKCLFKSTIRTLESSLRMLFIIRYLYCWLWTAVCQPPNIWNAGGMPNFRTPESVSFNPFVPNAPFLYPLKTLENRKVFWCFQGVEKGCMKNEWVMLIIISKYVVMFWSTKTAYFICNLVAKKRIKGKELNCVVKEKFLWLRRNI